MNSKRIQRALRTDQSLAEDVLTIAAVEARLFGHAGFPEAADALAYDAVQRTLAVGTKDGRVKIFGSDGVECTFRSPFQTATKQLQFLENKGTLLRLTTDGDVQLWGVEAGGFVDSLSNADEDAVTTACPLHDEPYVLLGCKSGKLQAAALLGSSGGPAGGAREACSLGKLGYEVPLEAIPGAKGSVVALACSSVGSMHRVIVVHSASSPCVWDIRYRGVVATTEPVLLAGAAKAESAAAAPRKMSWRGRVPAAAVEPEQDAATCACWLSSRGQVFAVGYASGAVRLYSIPDAALGEPPPVTPFQATLLHELRPCPEADSAMPVRAVWHVPGSKASEASSILILGGQGMDEPDMLYLLPVESSDPKEDQEQHPLPWFGAIQGLVLVPPQHSLDARSEPAALITLNEGGQLIVYDMKTLQPLPLSLPLQELPPVTASAFVDNASPPEDGEERPHAFSAADLRALHAASAESPERAAAHRWRWMLNSGKLPSFDDTTNEAQPLLLTGHRDGHVRMWDMSCEVPRLLGTAPHDLGGAGSRLQPVSIIKVCQAAGLLLIGHSKGEARLYQYSSHPQDVTLAHISPESREEPELSSSGQPAGFQAVLRLTLHEAAVTLAALCSRAGLLALADQAGALSVVDLQRPAMLCTRQLSEQPIAALGFGVHSFRPQRGQAEKVCEPSEAPVEDRLTLFVEAADCSMVLLDARTGKPLNTGKDPWLRPKHADSALGMVLLGASGLPTALPPGDCVLPWAQNTRDTHGISFNTHGSMSGGSPMAGGSLAGSPSPTHSALRNTPRHFREAVSFPASESSNTGARIGKGDPEPKQHSEDEQSGQKWHDLAARVNSESQAIEAHSQLSDIGSPPARNAGTAPEAPHQAAEARHDSLGPPSPKSLHESAGAETSTKQGSSETDDAASSADGVDADEDDDDDLLSAAVAAVEAEDIEAKRGRKRFGLLQKAPRRHSQQKSHPEQHLAEQQPPRRESTPVRELRPEHKRALGRWARASIDKRWPTAGLASDPEPASEATAQQSAAAAAESAPARSPFADLPAQESLPASRAAFPPTADSGHIEQPARSSGHADVGSAKGSQEEHPASPAVQAVKAESAAARQSHSVGLEHRTESTGQPRMAEINSSRSTGVPSMAPKVSIRGSVSDNTHERFTAARTHADPAEAASSGTVSHVVMASSNHLRLYTVGNIREADRSTAKKVSLSQPIAFAGAFASPRGSGIACLSPTGILHVFSLPSLELLVCQELQDGLTFPWAWKPEHAALIRAAALAQDGQLAMVSACGELARLGLVAGTPAPSAATSLYDWDLATAALAASHAVKLQLDATLAQSRQSAQPPPPPKEAGASSNGSAAAAAKKGFGGFLSQVKDAASKVVDDTSKNLNQGLDKLGARGTFGAPERAAAQAAPSLAEVLSSGPAQQSQDAPYLGDNSNASSATAVRDQRADEEAQRSELLGSSAGKRATKGPQEAESAFSALFGGRAHGKPPPEESASQEPDVAPGRGGRHLWSEEDEDNRAELFKGAKTGADKSHHTAKPGVRTAEDIKAAYGRPSTTKRVEGLSGVMDENRARLAERGEKLRTLQDKMEAMSGDAEDFASLARQLREREANKNWWQL